METLNTAVQFNKFFTGMFSGYKAYACAGIAAAALIACFVLFILKKRNVKNFLSVLAAAVVCAAFVLFTNFQSTEKFYGATDKGNGEASVSITVRCDKVTGTESEYIPADGCIIPVTKYNITAGETVYDVLVRAVREYGIRMECDGVGGENTLAYVKGMNYLYEFDFGELSGWVYLVNGVRPSLGCGAYELKDGDVIEWQYSLQLGNDIAAEADDETS